MDIRDFYKWCERKRIFRFFPKKIRRKIRVYLFRKCKRKSYIEGMKIGRRKIEAQKNNDID